MTVHGKATGHNTEVADLEQEFLAFIDEIGCPGVMPMHETFVAHGRYRLAKALEAYGGCSWVGHRLGLVPASGRKPRGYWRDFANVEREIHEFIAQHGTTGVMPNQADLLGAGRADLMNAIKRNGGFLQVAKRLDLERTDTRNPQGYWDDPETVEREVLRYVADHGEPGMMPTQNELVAAGRHDLRYGVHRYGGFPVMARRLGLATRRGGDGLTAG